MSQTTEGQLSTVQRHPPGAESKLSAFCSTCFVFLGRVKSLIPKKTPDPDCLLMPLPVAEEYGKKQRLYLCREMHLSQVQDQPSEGCQGNPWAGSLVGTNSLKENAESLTWEERMLNSVCSEGYFFAREIEEKLT